MKQFIYVRAFYYPLRLPILVLLLITFIGIIGFMSIENFNFSDALYMTVITESTVGFSEVKPLNPEGRYFTILLIVLSFGVFAFAISSITSFITSGEYRKNIILMKKADFMRHLKHHTIICGYGKVGIKASEELELQKLPHIVIDNAENTGFSDNISFVNGDATIDATLMDAGIEKADNIIIALPSDSDALMVIISSKALNPKINIVARVSNKMNISKFKSAGANHIISPDSVGGKTMARMVVKPDLAEFTERVLSSTIDEKFLDEVVMDEKIAGKMCIEELNKEFLAGCLIVGFKTKKGDFIINPSLDTEIEPGSKLFILGRKEQINQLHINMGV